MMDQKYFEEIKAREQAATPGPWEADYNTPFSNDFVGIYEETEGYIVKAEDEDEGYSTRPEDAAFIAHARSDIPALLAEVERLNRELSRIRSNAADDKKMLEKDSAAKDQQIATLKKALEAACEDAADEQCPHEFDLYTCGKCAGCPHGGEVHTDAARDAKCWHDYYIQKVQEQEEKK